MTTRKNEIICPWCGTRQRRGFFDKYNRLTAWQYPSEHVDGKCDNCGKAFEVRAEECVFYKTKKVKA